MNGMAAYDLWSAGFVRRWHMNPAMSHIEDFNCAHQGRCAVLVMALFPDHSLDLLRATVTHDLIEVATGDLSGPAKAETDGAFYDLACAYRGAEAEAAGRFGINFDLCDLDRQRLKLVDALDAYLFVALRNPFLLARGDWGDALEWLLAEAAVLGVSDQVETLIHEVGP